MTTRTTRRAVIRTATIFAVAVAAGGGILMSGTAQAQTVASGSLVVTSDSGDYIGQGQSYNYSTATADTFTVSAGASDQVVSVSVTGANGDWWYLDLAAPSGQALAAGDYTGAARYPFNTATQPGLSFYGDGRGCNTVTGSFTVDKVDFGPNGYVQDLDASFEQHCEGATAASYGQIDITNPPPPPTLDLGVSVDPTGTASTLDGTATVGGTVTCNVPDEVTVSGTVTQDVKNVLTTGPFSTSVACTPGAAVPWTASATPSGNTAFGKGDVEVDTQVSGTDPNYGGNVTASQTTEVSLSKG